MAATGRLSGAVAIVTGASAGIGEAVARTFAREGAAVAIVSRNRVEANRVGDFRRFCKTAKRYDPHKRVALFFGYRR